jgi:hypothetical protein
MYCVICLKNRARDFYCPYCMPKIKQILTPYQISVGKDVKEMFINLPLDIQYKIISLTNKRLGNVLRLGNYRDTDFFKTENIIKEYTDMVKLNHLVLDLPISNNGDLNQCRYRQYESPKEITNVK